MLNRWTRIRDVFARASELSEDSAREYLEHTCAADPSLLDQVRDLLDAGRLAGSFLDQPAAARFDPGRLEDLVGQRIGPYQVLRMLGSGGMGAVYLAERADEEFRKQVALKLVLPGSQRGDLIRRFRQERQILAKLEHPGIARLLDGGQTSEGVPFLVMEYVDGQQIDKYCIENKLSIPARLTLILKICRTIQYAHEKLVVHRDIKTGNIVVTREGEPRLLDFGIAKVIGGEEALNLTRTGAIAATPEYASPEQISGGSVGIGADIYSLGVLLFRLLVQQNPYGLSPEAGFTDLVVAIQTKEPLRPSSVDPAISKDLDAIVQLALEKEPSKRYASASEFADDIERHLDSKPVKARPSTPFYVIRKFIRRKPAVATAVLIAAASLLGGAALAAWQAHRANQQRDQAQRRFEQVRSLANYFVFDFNDSIASMPGAMKARETIVRKGLDSLDSLSRDAGDDVKLMGELASAYERIGDLYGNFFISNTGNYRAAQLSYERSTALRDRILRINNTPAERLAYARSLARLTDGLVNSGLTKDAVQNYDKCLKIFSELTNFPETRPAALSEQVTVLGRSAIVLLSNGKIVEAMDQANRQLAVAETLRKERPNDSSNRQYLIAVGNHGNALRLSGKLADAEVELKTAVRLMDESLVRNQGDVTIRRLRSGANFYLSLTLLALKRETEAVAPMRAALDEASELSAADSGDSRLKALTNSIRVRLSQLYEKTNRREDARKLAAENLERMRLSASRPASSPDEWNDYADALNSCPYPELSRPGEAVAYARRAVEVSEGKSLVFRVTLAESLEKAGNLMEAAKVSRETLSAFPRVAGPTSRLQDTLAGIASRAEKK